MLIVGDIIFLDQFWMRTSKKYVSNFFDNFFKVKWSMSKVKIFKMPCLDL